MKRNLIITAVFLTAVFIGIQFIPVEEPQILANNSDDLILNNSENIPLDIQNILINSCYDCHSFQPKMPWYSNIAPVKWLVYKDINEGVQELNFSVWNQMDAFTQMGALDEINTEIQDGEMPLEIYTKIHKDAIISEEEKLLIRNWVEEFTISLSENMWE